VKLLELKERPLIYRRPVIKYLFPVKVLFFVIRKKPGTHSAEAYFKIKITNRRGLPIPFAKYEVTRNGEVVFSGRVDSRGEAMFTDYLSRGEYLYYCYSPEKELKTFYWGCSDGIKIEVFNARFLAGVGGDVERELEVPVTLEYDRQSITITSGEEVYGFAGRYVITYPRLVEDCKLAILSYSIKPPFKHTTDNSVEVSPSTEYCVFDATYSASRDTKITGFRLLDQDWVGYEPGKTYEVPTDTTLTGGGRLIDSNGLGLPFQKVALIDREYFVVREALTDIFGYFRFDEPITLEWLSNYKFKAYYMGDGEFWKLCETDWISFKTYGVIE